MFAADRHHGLPISPRDGSVGHVADLAETGIAPRREHDQRPESHRPGVTPWLPGRFAGVSGAAEFPDELLIAVHAPTVDYTHLLCQERTSQLLSKSESSNLDETIATNALCRSMGRRKRHPAVEQWIQSVTSKGGTARAKSLTPAARKKIASAGGKASAAKLTPEERSANARRAVLARWAKRAKA